MISHDRLDVFGYEELCQRCLGNLALAERILGVFLEGFGNDIGQLEEQLASCQWEQARRIAHRMKGSAANTSAGQLHQLATDLERTLEEQQVDTIQRQLGDLRSAWARFLDQSCRTTGTSELALEREFPVSGSRPSCE